MRTVKSFCQNSTICVLALSVGLVLGVSTTATAGCDDVAGDAAAGDVVFHQTCVACHGQDGHGKVPGAPDFPKKGGVLSKPYALLLQHIKNGFREPGHPIAMPPKGGNPGLTDEDIANVHAYLHKQFGCG